MIANDCSSELRMVKLLDLSQSQKAVALVSKFQKYSQCQCQSVWPVSCCRRYLSQVLPLPGAEARAVSRPGAALSVGGPRHQEIFSLCSASLLSCTGNVMLVIWWLFSWELQSQEVENWGEYLTAVGALLPGSAWQSSSCPSSCPGRGGCQRSGFSSLPAS